MVVIILVGQADRFSHQILSYFEDKYMCKYFKESFTSVRSTLANQDPNTLYLVPDLTKPERYEIYCLARKNKQKFITIIDELKDESSISDKNPLVIKEFDGDQIEKIFSETKTSKTIINDSTKISLRNLSELKSIFNKVNLDFKDQNDIVLKECEERIISAWKINPKITNEDVEKSYIRLLKHEMERKGGGL